MREGDLRLRASDRRDDVLEVTCHPRSSRSSRWVIFAIATVLPINMGALAFVAAFLVGTLAVGMSTDDIVAGFPPSWC
ncbi:dicarboxylate carrier protein MatC [Modestobacter roseus]|uniref:Dicarboxylate carrier protein MatC n=1 Tax=Modestobacter roseus TaxID=1181884 RepID=A0A562IKH2_9ACTN|nr:dicarboxylate carrier protein MatC [Modestobacter roseus]